tara:strand:- start:392 stop:667 length:276 start_codon:yes stop_codon:yes gene_type:complete
MSVDKKTTGEPTQETMLKAQINNIDIVGKILTEEANTIHEFMKSKKIIVSAGQSDYKKKLTNIVIALGVCTQYFDDKSKGLEDELKKINKK